jgi:hypothetical protein
VSTESQGQNPGEGRIARAISFIEHSGLPNTRLYLWGLPLALLASVAVHAIQPSGLVFAGYLAANLVAFAVTGLVYFALRNWLERGYLRTAGRISLAKLMVFGLALGLTKQLSTVVLVVAFGLESSLLAALLVRLITPLLGIWTVLSIAALQAGRERYDKLRQELITERARRGQAEVAPARSAHLQPLIDQIRAELPLEQAGEMGAKQFAALLRQIVETQIRPFSHEIWMRENETTPGYRTSELATRAILRAPYPLAITVTVYLIGTAPAILFSAPSGGGPLWLAVLAIGVTLGLWLANRSKRYLARAPRLSWLYLVTASALAVGLGGSVANLIFGPLSGVNQVLIWITSIWWLASITLTAGVIDVARKTHAEQLASLRELVGDELAGDVSAAQRRLADRETANFLHSSVQNQLLSQALRIERDPEFDLSAELVSLLKLLEGEDPAAFDLAAALADLRADWAGLVDIELELVEASEAAAADPEALNPSRQHLLYQLITEGINNAHRHGRASNIKVTLAEQLEYSTITVTDDGLGLNPAKRPPGLGTMLFATAGDWSLINRPEGGAELTLRVLR